MVLPPGYLTFSHIVSYTSPNMKYCVKIFIFISYFDNHLEVYFPLFFFQILISLMYFVRNGRDVLASIGLASHKEIIILKMIKFKRRAILSLVILQILSVKDVFTRSQPRRLDNVIMHTGKRWRLQS